MQRQPRRPGRSYARRGWFVRVTTLMLAQSTQNLTLGILALLLPLIREDIPMTFTEAGALSVATTLTYALGQVPAGYLGDRLGAKRVMLCGMIGLNALTLVVAIAPSYGVIAILFTLIGAFRALAFPPGMRVITAEFPASRRATAMSVFMVSGFAANLFVSLGAPPLVGPLGWRGVFVVFGAVSLLIVGLYWGLSRVGGPVVEPAGPPGRRHFRVLFTHPVVVLASVIQFTRLAVTMALRFWLPTYLITDKGFTLGGAALVVGVGAGVSVVATFLGGHLTDRLQRPVLVIGTCLGALAAGLALLTVTSDLVATLLLVAVLFIFVQSYSGALFDVPLRVLGTQSAGTLNGFGNLWANVGGLAAGFLLGLVKDGTGSFDPGWIGLAVLCLIALAAALVMAAALRRHETQ
jgi:ACS family D-galactonate transporter-like MFS transporter